MKVMTIKRMVMMLGAPALASLTLTAASGAGARIAAIRAVDRIRQKCGRRLDVDDGLLADQIDPRRLDQQ